MKKSFLFLCGLIFAANAVAAAPGCDASIALDQDRPGLAIDIDDSRIISGCGSRIMTAADIETEKKIARIPNGEKRDADNFDPEMGFIFCTGKKGILTIVQESAATHFEVADAAATQQSNWARGP